MTDQFDTVLETWTAAERSGDTATLDRLLADDFVAIGPVGFVLDKPAWLARYDAMSYEDLHLDEVSVHQHGDAAVAVAHQHAVGTARGHAMFTDTRVSFTIVHEDSEPRIAGIQYSFIGMPGS
jgi:hypothetical protein